MFYNRDIKDIAMEFETSIDNGLTDEQISTKRTQYGYNKLTEKKPKSKLILFLEQFKDFLVIILIIAAIISAITGNIASTIVIITVICLNALLGSIQTIKAEKSLENLKKMSAPMAKVIRNGKVVEVKAEELVLGDIVKLEAGDIVPSDGRVIESSSLKVNESALTGEADAVEKYENLIESEKVALGDQNNMVFSSSLVTYGRGRMLVTAIGDETEIGQIAKLLSETKERQTPLQVSMDNFSKKLSLVIMIICLVVFALSLYRGETILDALLFAVALAVAAIPEALSSIITISLAIGTSRMSKQNAIVKKLQAVEGLGSVSIICSDKTGTLTQNKMTVKETYSSTTNQEELLLSSILCNDTVLVDGKTFGDPTETAFVEHYRIVRDNYYEKIEKYARLQDLPFDSERKLMSTLHFIDEKYVIFTKGAPDILIDKCKYIQLDDNIIEMTDEKRKEIVLQNEKYSQNGLRVLGFAKKNIESERKLVFDDESDLIFVGLIAEMDPPREESAQAVKDCKKAGIKPIMITGDHKITAVAIAKKIGIMDENDEAITGLELDEMSDEDLASRIQHISVYARVSPDNKIRIVKAWQRLGNIVAMTGDGVNDAPALKQADIGIAMGITGTEVSKDAASMVLADDNFATIIKSVLNGRNIYNNIVNSIKFLLSGNMAGIFAVFFASIVGLPAPFNAIQLLFINLITDSLPALAIAMEPSNKDLIKNKPRKSDESMITLPFFAEISLQGLVIAVATMIGFYIGYEINTLTAMTMAFAVLCLGRLWHGFNARGKQNIFKLKISTNKWVVGALCVGAALLACVLFIPSVANICSMAHLSLKNSLIVLGLSILPTVVIQLKKITTDCYKKEI